MKVTWIWLAVCFAASAAAQEAAGPTVRYNEAVRVINGKRVVELPPRNPHYPNLQPSPVNKAGSSLRYMIETTGGLVQCTSSHWTAESCEPSDHGTKRRARTWVVKKGGAWQGCIGLETPKECRALYLPRSSSPMSGPFMPDEAS